MSIKSQKSLNEECSEIFEKSYSARSVSEESLSIADDEESLSRELMKRFTPAVLSKLRRCFKKARERNAARNVDRRVEEVMRAAAAEEGIEFAANTAPQADPLCLDEPGFVEAINNIFGSHKYTSHARKLFQALDPFGSGRVWWRGVVTRVVAAGATATGSRTERWKPANTGEPRRLTHCQRETIVKLVNIERKDSFCYAAVSKGGRVGVYSGHMKLMSSYEVFYHRADVRRRVKNCWVTDAIYMKDVQCVIFSASDRSLTIYDVATLTHSPLFCITGLPNIPTCLAYRAASSPADSSELVFGTERGDLTRIHFLQPRVSLFYTKCTDNINYYFWMELASPPHTSYCVTHSWRRVHCRSVRRVSYIRNGDIVLSCSHDASVSVRARHVPEKLNDYVFRVQRGVSCFHAVSSLHLLATGSCDGVVRLWETTQSSPYASLTVPGLPAVVDVAVIASLDIVVAYHVNCTVNIWDINDECLLQCIKIKFPFLGVLGKKVEFGTYCIHPGPTRKKINSEGEATEPALASTSRRGSSVCRGATGGLVLQEDQQQEDYLSRDVEKDPEYQRFDRPELLITCCDFVCTLNLDLRGTDQGVVLSPPSDTLRARRPSFWELPEDIVSVTYSAGSAGRQSPVQPSVPTSTYLMIPGDGVAESTEHDLNSLLEKAGLQGILEKDFVLMQGLKSDLNWKLHQMESNLDATVRAVRVGGPHLALTLHSPEPLPPPRNLHQYERYNRLVRLLPPASIAATPTGSETSTPRSSRFNRL